MFVFRNNIRRPVAFCRSGSSIRSELSSLLKFLNLVPMRAQEIVARGEFLCFQISDFRARLIPPRRNSYGRKKT